MDSVDQKFEKTFDTCAEQVITASNALNAELDAIQAQYEIQKAKADAGNETIKSDITEKINWFKEEFCDKQQLGADKASLYEKDLSSGFARIKQAFKNLHH